MAQQGGAMGVRVGTFDDLYTDILHQRGIIVTRLTEAVQKRLLRSLVNQASLQYYRSIQHMPGFIQLLMDTIRELKAGGITPGVFTSAVQELGRGGRLVEVGRLYQAYQDKLESQDWTDYIGAGWLARDALQGEEIAFPQWTPCIVDGFDDFSPVQIQVLAEMSQCVKRMIITLTAEKDGSDRPVVHKRFQRTRQQLEDALDLEVQFLPQSEADGSVHPALKHIERTLFRDQKALFEDQDAVKMIAAPVREGEVRSALRWIKETIVREEVKPRECAVLFRNIEPYRPYLYQTADEFGVPLHVEQGRPLRENPAVDALLNLLHLANPEEKHLSWRETISAWRSPYFDLKEAFPGPAAAQPLGIELEDAETLSWVARWGSVIQGVEQWEEAFARLIKLTHPGERRDEDLPEPPRQLPRGKGAVLLRDKFRRFVQRVQPPQGQHPYTTFIGWVEGIIGDQDPQQGDKTDLNLAQRAAQGPEVPAARDLEALKQLKNVFRGLIWAEKSVSAAPVSFGHFLEDLEDAVEGETYQPAQWDKKGGILAADVVAARGIPFKTVALIGLGEGEFPQTISEDPFLRDHDREFLNQRFQLPLFPSTLSWEGEYFYEAISRPTQSVLLTRSRIADNGAPWQPSPFWEEVQRCVTVIPERLVTHSLPSLHQAASKEEFIHAITSSPDLEALWQYLRSWNAQVADHLDLGQKILQQRKRDGHTTPGIYDGGLSIFREAFDARFGSGHLWSASRLESYQTCPYFFFTDHVLGLEPKDPPQEGLDARQLGNIYHHILENLYLKNQEDPTLPQLIQDLPAVADAVLDQAPEREGFRETAWWEETRHEIKDNILRSLQVLEGLSDRYCFLHAEKTFGIHGRPGPALEVAGSDGEAFRLRGYIDRIDQGQDGTLRIIDYKISSPYPFHDQAVREGKKLQLPLYALAAEDALSLGRIEEGFYFHVQHAEPSNFRMSSFSEGDHHGPDAAIRAAVAGAWRTIHGARGGKFVPQVPDRQCPDYCPAAQFCWHYTPRRW